MIPLNESQPELQKELQAWQQVSRKIISRIERELFREPQVAIVICPESHSCKVRLCPHKTPHTLCLSCLNQPNHVCPNCVHSYLVIVTEERELANPLPEKFSPPDEYHQPSTNL